MLLLELHVLMVVVVMVLAVTVRPSVSFMGTDAAAAADEARMRWV